MGMYTELIFGARLKQDVPQEVIDVLNLLFGEDPPWENDELDGLTPDHEFFKCDRWKSITTMSSYYFGTHPTRSIQYDDNVMCYTLSSRANLKNYDNEIEKFLDWIKPYIEYGSGVRNFYAIVTYEEAYEPTIYYLNT